LNFSGHWIIAWQKNLVLKNIIGSSSIVGT
jgi:hypothetical protein